MRRRPPRVLNTDRDVAIFVGQEGRRPTLYVSTRQGASVLEFTPKEALRLARLIERAARPLLGRPR